MGPTGRTWRQANDIKKMNHAHFLFYRFHWPVDEPGLREGEAKDEVAHPPVNRKGPSIIGGRGASRLRSLLHTY